jgi:hypothetical protein
MAYTNAMAHRSRLLTGYAILLEAANDSLSP